MDRPSEATHERDGDYYRVTNKVQFWQFGYWNDCDNCFDVDGWRQELNKLPVVLAQTPEQD
jgi:hypothetical protein